MSLKPLTSHHRRLAKAGLLKKVVKRNTASGNYMRNVYQLVHPERVKKSPDREDFVEIILKEYSVMKIEEKLDLLMKRKNIQNSPLLF